MRATQAKRSFKKNISDFFFDKEITELSVNEATDNEGTVRREVTEGESFYGNVRFDNFEDIRKDFGITEEIDIVITTAYNLEDKAVKYDDILYIVIKNIPRDTHNLLVCKKWLLTQSDLISA